MATVDDKLKQIVGENNIDASPTAIEFVNMRADEKKK